MADFYKNKLNPMDVIKRYWPDVDASNITYNPNLKSSGRDYWRIEQAAHDGTCMFTAKMFQKLLVRLLRQDSFYLPNPPNPARKLIRINYEVGDIKHAVVFCDVELGGEGRKYPGQRERVRMPVKCSYVYSD